MAGKPIRITVAGPFFSTTRRRIALHRMIKDIAKDVTAYAERTVHQYNRTSFKHPTHGEGGYDSRVHSENRDDGGHVTDGGVVYGPWLEGTSDRNKTTRFKGYAMFRRATQTTDREVRRLAKPHVERFIRELS